MISRRLRGRPADLTGASSGMIHHFLIRRTSLAASTLSYVIGRRRIVELHHFPSFSQGCCTPSTAFPRRVTKAFRACGQPEMGLERPSSGRRLIRATPARLQQAERSRQPPAGPPSFRRISQDGSLPSSISPTARCRTNQGSPESSEAPTQTLSLRHVASHRCREVDPDLQVHSGPQPWSASSFPADSRPRAALCR